ncbi:hypothetical protein KEM56_004071 [Ascosphaera pollenicola]|nr:hypothetical protein KEM56_004071 [Ascosphaera pollenicola]
MAEAVNPATSSQDSNSNSASGNKPLQKDTRPSEAAHSRIILYHQTHYTDEGEKYVDLAPMIRRNPGLTHLIVAALHLNEDPQDITLNDDSIDDVRYVRFWMQLDELRETGVKIMAMLGGAAPGSFKRLDGDDGRFEQYYIPLRNRLRRYKFEGIDLDVEEAMSLAGITRLIRRLREDFGEAFIITLAPVCTALIPDQPHLSGFDYFELEKNCGPMISWYNVQFYNGWGDPGMYALMIQYGWPQEKLTMGVLTNPANGSGYTEFQAVSYYLTKMMRDYPCMGGVFGWELFNALESEGSNAREWVFRIAIHFALRSTLEAHQGQYIQAVQKRRQG